MPTNANTNTNDLYTLYLNGRKMKILLVTDVHMRPKEFKNTHIYVPTQENVILRLIKAAEDKMFDAIIFLGDLFDCQYDDVAKALYHIILFERLNKAVEGNMFKLVGNHPLNNKRNYIITFFLTGVINSLRAGHNNVNIQKTLDGWVSNIGLTEPILKVPDRLMVNGSLFNFFHYNKTDKTYYDPLYDITPKTHIGLYHDNILTRETNDYVSELSNGGKFKLPSIEVDKDSLMLSNVDYAVFGDIHTRIGEFELTNHYHNHKVIMDVPGSLGRTANHTAQHHNDVNLPLFTIDVDGTVTKQHLNFPLVDYRDIFNIEKQAEEKKERKRMETFKDSLNEISKHVTFEDYLDNAEAPEQVKELIRTIINDKYSAPSFRENEFYKKMIAPYL